jgi:hypothetical protein
LLPQEWGVYTTTSAINPTMTWSLSGQYVCSAIALKAATSGSAPTTSALWVSGVEHGAVSGVNLGGLYDSTSPVKFQFPTIGNLGIVAFTMPTGGYPTAISSSVTGETWQQASSINTSGGGAAAVWYACNISPSQSRVLTTTLADGGTTGGDNDTFIFLDVSNALASSSCLDTTSTATNTTSGDQETGEASITFTVGPFGAANEFTTSSLSVYGSGVGTQAQTSGVNYLHGGFVLNNGFNQCSSGVYPPAAGGRVQRNIFVNHFQHVVFYNYCSLSDKWQPGSGVRQLGCSVGLI